MKNHVVIAPGYEPELRALRLDSLEGVAAFRGTRVKDQRGRRDVFRIDTRDAAGRPLTLYLKRMWKSRWKDALASAARHGRVWSKARTEFEHYRAAAGVGVGTAEPVAYGERVGLLAERFSFIVTRAAPGRPLDEWLAEPRGAAERAELLAAAGRYVRAMHDAGVAFPDLFARHLFVAREPGGGYAFAVIDLARLDLGWAGDARRARDLAALCASVPLRHASPRERVGFLRAYAGCRRPPLVGLVARRLARLLRRAKFRDFAAAAAAAGFVLARESAAEVAGLLV